VNRYPHADYGFPYRAGHIRSIRSICPARYGPLVLVVGYTDRTYGLPQSDWVSDVMIWTTVQRTQQTATLSRDLLRLPRRFQMH